MEQYAALIEETFSFMKSRVIITASELDLFTALDEQPATAVEMASTRKLDPKATTRILDCLITMDLLSKEGETYRVTKTGALLSSRHDQTILPMILHMGQLWKTWTRLTEVVREGSPEKQEKEERSDAGRAAFIGAMHSIGQDLSVEIARAYNPQRFTKMLDVGGASGTYIIAFLRENPHIKATLFDLEPVIPLARKRIESEGLTDRVSFVDGDFYKDDLPGGHDLVLLSAIIHQNSIDENIDLYRKAFHALTPGGAILIRDHIMNDARTKPPAGAMFAINMLVNTSGGDTYTLEEVKDGLEKAGFVNVRLVRTGERMDSLVEARKPE
jgi:hypothetical protein